VSCFENGVRVRLVGSSNLFVEWKRKLDGGKGKEKGPIMNEGRANLSRNSFVELSEKRFGRRGKKGGEG